MIVQGILDFFSLWVAGVVGLIPELPESFDPAVGAIATGGTTLVAWVGPLGALVPFSAMTTVIQWWLGSLVFWGAMVLLRVVLWVFGR